jgi:DNA-binding GntR family transcriptional regulator
MTSLHDVIYESLRRSIIVGDIVPGRTFSTRTVADQFGTSLIPARDAIKRLVAERALELLPNRTFCVPKMSRQRFQELLQVRIELEMMLTRTATPLLIQDELKSIELINQQMQVAFECSDVSKYLDANHRFHFLIYRAARSMEILPIVESLWLQVGPFLNGVLTQFGVQTAQDNHAEVIKALRRGDSQSAANAIRNDLADAADIILSNANFEVDADPTLVRRTQSANGSLTDAFTYGWLGEYKKMTMENRL